MAGSLVTTFTWDYRNRLTEALVMSGTTTVADDKFTYDMFNRRIGKLTNGGTQSWTVYDGVNPYADFSGSTLQYRYLYGNAVDQLFARFDGTNTGNDSTIWYLTDNLGSVRQMVKTDGSLVDTVTYGDSYGKTPTDSPTGSGDRFKFAGMQYDSEIGLYYDQARYYDPNLGRFLTEDPLSFAAGDANLYRYVWNSPLNFTDPSGLDTVGIYSRPTASKGFNLNIFGIIYTPHWFVGVTKDDGTIITYSYDGSWHKNDEVFDHPYVTPWYRKASIQTSSKVTAADVEQAYQKIKGQRGPLTPNDCCSDRAIQLLWGAHQIVGQKMGIVDNTGLTIFNPDGTTDFNPVMRCYVAY
jgi:RHS repeat-associated protein